MIASESVLWKTWRQGHPDTLALKVEGLHYGRATFRHSYVIGVTLGESATAFPYKLAAKERIINERVGSYPVVVHVNPETRGVHVYLRQVDDRVLTFAQQGDLVQDQETGSAWQMDCGLAVDGPLKGQALHNVPYIPAFPEAWRDFYPDSRRYGEGK